MSGARVRVLFVEDQAADARLFSELLRDYGRDGFSLDSRPTLKEALDALAGEPAYDLLLIDLNLPDSDGLETFRTLLPAARGRPVVVLTMLEDQELAIAALSEGAQDYLIKNDISGPRLVASLRYALERHGLYQRLQREKAHSEEVSQLLGQEHARLDAALQELQASLKREQLNSQRLLELERLRRDFLSVFAHDLRSPMQVISAYTELLMKRWATITDDKRQRYVGIVHRSSVAIQMLLENVLHYGRMEEGAFSYELQPVELPPLLQLAVHMLTTDDNRVRLEVPDRLAPVQADERRLLQVVLNLLSNALKFSDAQSPVRIRARELPDRQVQVDVIDNGPGIAPEDQDRLFQRFSRVPVDGGYVAPGLGLGLYISRTMIEAQHGSISLESQPGRGTTVSFLIPLSAG